MIPELLSKLASTALQFLLSRLQVLASELLTIDVLCVVILVGLSAGANAQETASGPKPAGWKLVWNDEFNGPNGSAVDLSKWVFDTGAGVWGNQELEYYTSRPQNVFIQDGNLVIRAQRENFKGPDGVSKNYTSGRLKTAGKFSPAYGRFEARIKIPTAKARGLHFGC